MQTLDHNGVKLAREGRRCDPFDYSTKLLITVDDYNKYIEQEFRRVKSTSDNSKYWITVSREVGKLYADDKLDRLNKCGSKTLKKFRSIGVFTVYDLAILPKDDCFSVPGISIKLMESMLQQVSEASTETSPPVVDHRKAANPYLSKFGPDVWEEKIRGSQTFANAI